MTRDERNPDESGEQNANLAHPCNSLKESFGHAWQGLSHVFRTQRNLRLHFAVGIAVYLLAFWLGVSMVELAVLTLTVALVLITEVVNTAFEVAIDLYTDRYHPLAKVAKDVAAGGVLLSAFFAVLVGILIFAPYLVALIARR